MEIKDVTEKLLKDKKTKFSKEKNFVDYLILNIDKMCFDFFEEELDFFKREYSILPRQNFGVGTNQKVDLFIRTKSGKNILIECKKPFNLLSDGNRAISQCLSYLVDAKRTSFKIDKMAIFTTRLHPTTLEIITEYKLPIEVWVIKENTFIGFNKQ